MQKTIAILGVTVLFGISVGYLLGFSKSVHLASLNQSDHAPLVTDMDHSDHTCHDHNTLTNLSADLPAPTIALKLHADGSDRRNLEIVTSNFTFAPGAVNGAHVPGQGHAHVYVNDVKITRAYAPWIHLTNLPQGKVEVKVTLNANDHSQLAIDDAPLVAHQIITIE